MTNAERVLAILHERDLSGEEASVNICDALGVDPENEFDPERVYKRPKKSV